jgi:glutamate 5-kinase
MTKKTSKKRIWVIKIGSAIFVDGGPILLRALMQQVALLKNEYNIDVIWVTSGAIASAKFRTQIQWTKLPEKQALSAIGQPMLMDTYNLALSTTGLLGAQVLLTYNDMARPTPRKNLKNTLQTLLTWDVLPILNENDAVATEEIQFGDNDLLSAKVASLMKAERLVILTNVEGLFDSNPEKNKKAKLIPRLPRVTKAHLATVDKTAISNVGRGGMYSKIRAAAFAQKYHVPTWVIRGDVPQGLIKIAAGENIGTHIGPALKRK